MITNKSTKRFGFLVTDRIMNSLIRRIEVSPIQRFSMQSGLAASQLMMIEQVWGFRFENIDELARWIGETVHDHRQVLSVTSSINNLIAMKQNAGILSDKIRITRPEFDLMVRNIRW